MALCDPEVKEALDGNVVFMGVPNEEGSTAVELKSKLIEEGKVRYIGGKQEFVRLGVMDDIDLTVGHHVLGDPSVDPKSYVAVNGTSMGHMDKAIHSQEFRSIRHGHLKLLTHCPAPVLL